jgi:hypothetical protein
MVIFWKIDVGFMNEIASLDEFVNLFRITIWNCFTNKKHYDCKRRTEWVSLNNKVNSFENPN